MRAAAWMLAVAAALVACGEPSAGGGREGRKGKSLGALGEGLAVPNPGVAEPSGIAFHARRQRLFVVGDEGRLAELDTGGGVLDAVKVHGNLEDVAVHEPSGDLVLVDEVRGELLVYDPGGGGVRSRWRLDTEALVGKVEGGGNGFEGLAFRPQAGQPGGGVFYLVHQRGPALVAVIAFDPMGAGGTIGAASLLKRWGLPGHRDLTAAAWSPELQRVLVLADAEDELLVVDDHGHVDATLPVPGTNQEGLCLDAEGALWIADDRGRSVVRYPGALAAIRAVLEESAPQPPQAGRKKRKED
jgi:uncharacterized protein YjiK